jgi:hypothetical protein
MERLLAASSSTRKKPTFKIKRFGSGKLKGASYLQKEKEKPEKTLRLNGGSRKPDSINFSILPANCYNH